MISIAFRLISAVVLSFIVAHPQSRDDVIARVSTNVQEFQDLLPDFVCEEKVTSTKMESGRITKQRIVESIFTGVQKPSTKGNVRLSYTESREVTSVDGKAVRHGARFPKLPFVNSGGFSSIMVMTFASKNLPYHNYELTGSERIRDLNTLVVRFVTKEGQQELGTYFQGRRFNAKDVGTAWIDADSMQIARLELRFLNLPPTFASYSTAVDYGPSIIGERQFWLPTTVRADLGERNSKQTASYVAEYSHCRKFVASVEIKVVP